MRLCVAILGCLLATSASSPNEGKISLGEAAEHAVQQSKLTLPGSKPFHLKAEIVEITNPSSEYQAKIEEDWVSPEKWRRTIESPEFSQTLIVNGDKVFEKDTGDYFPWWLDDMVTAIFDPLPNSEMLKKVDAQVAKPSGSEHSNTCADLHTKIDRWVICFEGSHGLLTSALTRGYEAEFKDFKEFAGKRVARRIGTSLEPGTTIEAKITELTELSQPDEELFVIKEPTPPQEQIKSVAIDEDALRKLSRNSTDIDWPPVGGGLTTGGCVVYVSADRAGHMREVWPHGCDNAGLQDPLRELVKKWELKPATANGSPVQVQALVTFRFQAKVVNSNPQPELSDAEARKLAANVVEPVFPAGGVAKGAEIIVTIAIDEAGKLAGVQNTHNLSTPVFLAAYHAVGQWHFQPYVKDGKAQYFHADIVFHVQ